LRFFLNCEKRKIGAGTSQGPEKKLNPQGEPRDKTPAQGGDKTSLLCGCPPDGDVKKEKRG